MVKGRSILNFFMIAFLLTIVSFSAFATITFDQPDQTEWKQHGFDRWSTGAYNYPFVSFYADVDNGSNFTYSNSKISGGNYQPTIFDWDNDGVSEIISFGSNIINVYDASSNELVVEFTQAISGSVSVEPACFDWTDNLGIGGDPLADNPKFCVYAIGNTIYTTYYQDDQVFGLADATLHSDYVLSSGWACHVSDDYPIPYCFAMITNTTHENEVVSLVQYRADVSDDISYVDQGSMISALFQGIDSFDHKPVISDINFDDQMEIVWVGQGNSDGDPYLLVAEWNASTNLVILDTDFSGDGKYNINVDANYWGDFLVHDIDSADDEEICWFQRTTSIGNQIYCVSSDGTSELQIDTTSQPSDTAHSIVVADVDGDNVGEFCVSSFDFATDGMYVRCFETATGVALSDAIVIPTGVVDDAWLQSHRLVSAKMNDDDTFDLILGEFVVYMNSTGGLLAQDEKNIDGSFSVPVNLNRDAYLDIVSQSLNSLNIHTDRVGVGISTSSITLNTAINNSGIYGYNLNPCINTEVDFRALESQTETMNTGVTYYNSDDDSERMATACGGAEVFKNGTFSATPIGNPEVSCNFSVPATYNVVLYFQDTGNPTDYSTFETIEITAIDGIAGQTCGLPSDLITSPEAQVVTDPDIDLADYDYLDDPEGFWDAFWSTIFGDMDHPILRMLVALFVIGSIIGVIFKNTKGQATELLYIFGLIGGLVLTTAMKLISIYWTMAIVILVVATAVIKAKRGI